MIWCLNLGDVCSWPQENTSNWGVTHYNDVIMGEIVSQITSLTIVYSMVYSGADQRKPQSSASLAFVRGIHRWPVNSPHKRLVTRKMFSFDDVIMPRTHWHLHFYKNINAGWCWPVWQQHGHRDIQGGLAQCRAHLCALVSQPQTWHSVDTQTGICLPHGRIWTTRTMV